MSERTDRIRAAQAGAADLDEASIAKLLYDMLDAHSQHPWRKIGRCVYCGPCGVRLYQGDLPDGHPVWTPPRRKTAADEMRERWGKD